MTTKTQIKNQRKLKLEKEESKHRNAFNHKVPSSPSEVRALKRHAQALIHNHRMLSCRIKRLKRQRVSINQELDEIAKCMSLTYERGSSSAG